MQHPKENVLVIPTTTATYLCPAVFGLPPTTFEQTILDTCVFLDREEAETNFDFKQVIPYILVRHQSENLERRYLVAQRTSQQQEKRLHNRYSIGQGGHVTEQDYSSKDPILTGLMRELREEFTLAPDYGCTCVGLINDNSNDVGKVHFGLVYELRVSTLQLEVAEKEKHIAQWMDIGSLREHYERLENWSKIVVDHILLPA